MDPNAPDFVPAVDSPSNIPVGTNQPTQSTPGTSETSSIVHVVAITPGTPAETITTGPTDMPALNVTKRIKRAHDPAPTQATSSQQEQRTNNTSLTGLQTVTRSSNLATASHPVATTCTIYNPSTVDSDYSDCCGCGGIHYISTPTDTAST
jgi:hypothetical protein